ncbi:FMN-binding protein [Kocuria sp.]|uniref:FMN-binding protein n=1 Tax=Kocuria sp. TaxID=1871328 RepID=UPI0026E0C3C5|nr:FMN-binding protein [Kocuria sp.]MDO5619434.1 FMN-binding protein [Kocuria sp.]
MTTTRKHAVGRTVAVGAAATVGVLSTVVLNPSAMALLAQDTPWVQSQTSAVSESSTAVTASGTTTAGAQTYTGSTVQTRYGPVQVQATVDSSGTITDVTWLQSPTAEGKSVQINQRAMPALTDEALKAQSAQVSTIAGASYSSAGFQQSLQSALDQAGV